jgi:hypothetical protein
MSGLEVERNQRLALVSDQACRTFPERTDEHPEIFSTALREANLLSSDQHVVGDNRGVFYYVITPGGRLVANWTVDDLSMLNGHIDNKINEKTSWIEIPEEKTFFRSAMSSITKIRLDNCQLFMLVSNNGTKQI